jgi:hypothetical protein
MMTLETHIWDSLHGFKKVLVLFFISIHIAHVIYNYELHTMYIIKYCFKLMQGRTTMKLEVNLHSCNTNYI